MHVCYLNEIDWIPSDRGGSGSVQLRHLSIKLLDLCTFVMRTRRMGFRLTEMDLDPFGFCSLFLDSGISVVLEDF